MLRETSMPGCLIELGFITTPDEEQLLNSTNRVDDIARGIYQAFAQYKDRYDKGVSVPYRPTDDDKSEVPTIVPSDYKEEKVPAVAKPATRSTRAAQPRMARTCKAFAVAAKGYVEVIAEPCRQGYVPAAPELSGVEALIREVEVVAQLYTHQCRQTDGHVAITGEIAEDLKSESRCFFNRLSGAIRHIDHEEDYLFAQFQICFLEVRHFTLARAAPAGPEIQDDGFPRSRPTDD